MADLMCERNFLAHHVGLMVQATNNDEEPRNSQKKNGNSYIDIDKNCEEQSAASIHSATAADDDDELRQQTGKRAALSPLELQLDEDSSPIDENSPLLDSSRRNYDRIISYLKNDNSYVLQLWTSYQQSLSTHPIIIKSATAAILSGCADLLGQEIERQQQQKEHQNDEDAIAGVWAGIDLYRFYIFALMGLLLLGPLLHLYDVLVSTSLLLPSIRPPWTNKIFIRMLIDQIIFLPSLDLLILLYLDTLQGFSFSMIGHHIEQGLATIVITTWKIWIPASLVQILFCPTELRLQFLFLVSFVWFTFVSLLLNAERM